MTFKDLFISIDRYASRALTGSVVPGETPGATATISDTVTDTSSLEFAAN